MLYIESHRYGHVCDFGSSCSSWDSLTLCPGCYDGAKVFIKEIGGGRFNVIVEGKHGVVTALKNISQKFLKRLTIKYGWE